MYCDYVFACSQTIRKISWWHYRSGPTRSRPELRDAEAVAVTTQMTAAQLSPQEMAFTWEAIRAWLPRQQGVAPERLATALAAAFATVAGMIRQSNNQGLIDWCRACAAFVTTEADIEAFVEHMRAVLRLYALIAALPPPVAQPLPVPSVPALSE